MWLLSIKMLFEDNDIRQLCPRAAIYEPSAWSIRVKRFNTTCVRSAAS
ncbi:hypothetical protein PSGL111025_10660 [Psychrobacter glaciei]